VPHYKKTFEEKANLLALVTAYDYCHILVYGAPTVKSSNNNNNQQKEKPAIYEEVVDLNELEAEYKSQQYEDKFLSNKGRGKDVNPWGKGTGKSTYKYNPDVAALANKTEEKIEFPFDKHKREIIKEIMSMLHSYIAIRLNLDYHAKKEMIVLALRKLKNGLAKKVVKPRTIHLFHLLGKETLLTLFLRKHQEGNFPCQVLYPIGGACENLHMYHDTLYYRLYLCTEDYLNTFFEYIAASFKALNVVDLVLT